MALLFVASGGSNTSPYETWAKAATSLQTALTAATAGDVVVIQRNAVPSGDKELSADATYTVPDGVIVLAATNDGGSSFTYSPMGSGSDWIGNSTANRSVTFVPSTSGNTFKIAGLTIRNAGATTDNLNIFASAAVGHCAGDDIYFWCGSTSAATRVAFGSTIANQQSSVVLRNPTFRFASTSQSIQIRSTCNLTIFGGSLDGAGSVPDELLTWNTAGPVRVDISGFDASAMGSGKTIIGDVGSGANTAAPVVFLRQFRRGASSTVLATQSVTTRIGVEVYEFECQVGTTLNVFGYHNALGSLGNDASVYVTGGTANQSWRITTTSLCSPTRLFTTPWIDWYNTGTSAIMPTIEVLRIDSTTAYTDAQVWGEFTARVTASSVASDFFSDNSIAGASASNQATGLGTGSWTGAGGTAWSGKVDSGASLTPSAAGRLRGRVVCSVASATIYVDPLIRT